MSEFIFGDSKLLLPEMKTASVDLILTDPPYDFDEEIKRWFQLELERISNNKTIVFSPPENLWIPTGGQKIQYLFWVKPISTKNTSKSYSRFVECITVSSGVKWYPDRHWSQYTNVFMDLVDNSKLHPYRKPPSLIERLILNHTKEGDTVLDPFAGSGVVHEVCLRLNRNSISIEKDENYV